MVGVGGGGWREETLVLNSTNVFAALGSLKKKKKNSEKNRVSSKTKKNQQAEKEPEKEVFWAPAPLTVKSWADVDDDDDDDYYATTAPPKAVWAGAIEPEAALEVIVEAHQESESEEEGVDEVDEDVEVEDHGNDSQKPVENEAVGKRVSETSSAPKDEEKQLSKKELKKKELAELEAVLAEFGYGKSVDAGPENSLGEGEDRKAENLDEEGYKNDNSVGETKKVKKKKKKEKSSQEQNDSEDHANNSDGCNGTDNADGAGKTESFPAINVKEKLKNVALIKKKKSTKEIGTAARVAANEAAARTAKLAAAKKKQKNHYNQQPLR